MSPGITLVQARPCGTLRTEITRRRSMVMTRKRDAARTVLSLSALGLLVTSGLLFAGPLDPPAGPVTSSNKTLGEVEPRTPVNATNTPGDGISLFKITQPGSYYL